ncbi:MAG TPA: YceI family protein [Bryobacteraceae bacterium]|nr:YceI family protein [Bryobacteraceae bacterium]
MKKLCVVILVAASGSAQTVHVLLDPTATTINFTLGDVLHTVHGAFRLTQGDIWVDCNAGKAGGKITVNAATGESGSNARDSRMDKNVLQTSDYPDITFAPDRLVEGTVNINGDSEFQLHGLFGIHGSTHELTMKVKSHIEAGRVSVTAGFTVPYVKWGMKDPSTLFLKVSDAVQINIAAAGRTE